MRPVYQTEIENRISKFDSGFVFSAFDFRDIANTDAANKALSRLKKENKIRRIIQGYYDVPAYSQLISEYAMPDITSLAFAIARRYNWTISPSGDAVLNIMHLSTQVPNTWVYISDGPTRQFLIGNYTLHFKKCANREITGKSQMTNLIIQSLKALGKENVKSEHLQIIKKTVSKEDIDIAVKEAINTADWIYTLISDMAKEF